MELIREAHERGEASATGAAFLEDRICVFEGRPQLCGTHFEPDDHGMPQPCPIADPEHVNERRKALGMNTIEERTREIQKGDQPEVREKASQAVFARYLNVTTGLVSQWEREEKHPRGASLKLLNLVARNGLQAVA